MAYWVCKKFHAHFNLIYTGLDPAFGGFFWDGRALHLRPGIAAIQDPIEMHNTLEAAVAAVQAQKGIRKILRHSALLP